MKSVIPLLILTLASLAVAGCATTTNTATKTETNSSTDTQTSATAKKDDIVSYTPTGSWITQKRKRSEVTATDKEALEAQEAMREIQRRNNKIARGPGG